MSKANYVVLKDTGGAPVKAWIKGVSMEGGAEQQLRNVAKMPFIHKWVAAMPDVHFGKGATVGSVIATSDAVIPAAVGVDIGCGMMATKTSLTAADLPDNLQSLRAGVQANKPIDYARGRRIVTRAYNNSVSPFMRPMPMVSFRVER